MDLMFPDDPQAVRRQTERTAKHVRRALESIGELGALVDDADVAWAAGQIFDAGKRLVSFGDRFKALLLEDA